MSVRRTFTPAEDAVIRGAHAGQNHMRKVAKALNAGLGAIYRRMEELDLPRRKPDGRSPWRHAA